MNTIRLWSGFAIVTVAVAFFVASGSLPSPKEAGAETPVVPVQAVEPEASTPEGDPSSSSFWRYCSIDGFPASSCGGTVSSCPPGTVMSQVTWVGTCRNPVDDRDYIVSYNDCCGKGPCGGKFIHRNEGDKPVYYAHKSNDVGWCMGDADAAYNSTVSIVIGVADGPDH